MKKKVVLAGGTGFIGQYFEREFYELGYEVKIISRQPQHISWHDKSVNCRYNEANKQEIINSRTETTTILGESILACNNPPKGWLNSSTATIYRHAEDRPMTEENGEIGSGFSVDVAKTWE